MENRPYILLGNRTKLNLSQRFEGVLKVWVRDWLGNDFSDYKIDAVDTIQSDLKKRQKIQRIVKNQNGAWCALMWNPEMLESLASYFWHDNGVRSRSHRGKGQVVSQLGLRALENIMEPLMGFPVTSRMVDEEHLKFPEDPQQEGKGAISLSVRIKNTQIVFVLSSKSVDKWLQALPTVVSSKAPKLNSVNESMQECTVPIHIHFGGTDLKMSELMSLEEGDVLRLDSKIENPVDLIIDGSEIQLKGYLGKQSNKMAIRLVESES